MLPAGLAETAPTKPIRFHLVDGLRGLAALAVLGFHLNMPVVGESLGGGVRGILATGWVGVQVFFVLSGFVIAHSLRRVEPTVAFVGRFVLRRSLRLDPPYWATIAVALLSLWASNLLFTERRLPLPTAGEVGAHLVYLQEVLGYGQIVDVFWTLCLEFQMYLVFVALLTAGEALKSRIASQRALQAIALVAFSALLVVSLWSAAHRQENDKTWFFSYWYQFFAGALTYWVTTGRVRVAALASTLTGCLALALVSFPLEPLAVAGTVLILFIAARGNAPESWLSSSPFQWLGRISYSLYLIHTLLISRGWNGFSRLGFLEGRELLALATLGLLALFAANLWNRAFERPALVWSQRIRLLDSRSEVQVSNSKANAPFGPTA